MISSAENSGKAPLLDITGVAAYLGITERHVRRLVFERRIPYLKLGNRLRFDPDRLAEWLDTLSVDEDPPERRPMTSRPGLRPARAAGNMERRSRPRPVPEPPGQSSASG